MNEWTPVERRWAGAVAVFLAATYSLLFSATIGNFFMQSDIAWYAAIARGETRYVMQPFASRQLGPLVVRAIVAVLHCSLTEAFSIQGGVCLLFSLAAVCFVAIRTSAPRWVLAAILFVPFWPELLFGMALPDLWYTAVLSAFLLLLYREHPFAAACMLFPLMVSRESTSLTLLCFLLSAWTRLRWRGAALAVGATLAGSLTVARLTAGSVANNEHLPQFVYLLAKVPWNLARNIFGIDTWTNVNQSCGTPIWQHSLHLGAVRAVGYCGTSFLPPIEAAQAMLTTFGLLPLLAIALWWRSRKESSQNSLLRFCLYYGAISFVIAPLIGVWFWRLFGYAWPLFAIGIPLLFDRTEPGLLRLERPLPGIAFCALHLACCWIAFWQQLPWVVGLEAVLWIAGIAVLRSGFHRPASPLLSAA